MKPDNSVPDEKKIRDEKREEKISHGFFFKKNERTISAVMPGLDVGDASDPRSWPAQKPQPAFDSAAPQLQRHIRRESQSRPAKSSEPWRRSRPRLGERHAHPQVVLVTGPFWQARAHFDARARGARVHPRSVIQSIVSTNMGRRLRPSDFWRLLWLVGNVYSCAVATD